MKIKMKEMPISERPYEKLEMYGEKALSNAELLAIILKNGTAIVTDKCTGCGICVSSCPQKIIEIINPNKDLVKQATTFEEIKICVAYKDKRDGAIYKYYPTTHYLQMSNNYHQSLLVFDCLLTKDKQCGQISKVVGKILQIYSFFYCF